MMRFPAILFTAMLFLLSFSDHSTAKTDYYPFIPLDHGPIHEAFVPRAYDQTLLAAIAYEPPKPLDEQKPRQLDFKTQWIPGYWQWNEPEKNFVWVSGVWRQPPPGHEWIPGFWKSWESGWVWIPGFWSRSSRHQLAYVGHAPPEPLDENVPAPPSNHFFWVPGYWTFHAEHQQYEWIKGRWQEQDSHWVFVPSHWVWQPGGYVLVAGFWDWPLESLGTAYASVKANAAQPAENRYEPLYKLDAEAVVRALFLSYPNYPTFFQHHYLFHPEFWKKFCCQPLWWEWETWWGLRGLDQWSLWWWYTHPGYPSPSWMKPELSHLLPPPSQQLVVLAETMHPPAFVSPSGVYQAADYVHAIRKANGEMQPIIPSDPKALKRIHQQLATLQPDENFRLNPAGRRIPFDPLVVRPSVKKPKTTAERWEKVPVFEETAQFSMPPKPKLNAGYVPANPPVSASKKPIWAPKSPENVSSQADAPLRKEAAKSRTEGRPTSEAAEPAERMKPWRKMKPFEEMRLTRPAVYPQ